MFPRFPLLLVSSRHSLPWLCASHQVIICTSFASPNQPLRFRPPTSTDYLNSGLRKAVLSSIEAHRFDLNTLLPDTVQSSSVKSPDSKGISSSLEGGMRLLRRGEAGSRLGPMQSGSWSATWRGQFLALVCRNRFDIPGHRDELCRSLILHPRPFLSLSISRQSPAMREIMPVEMWNAY